MTINDLKMYAVYRKEIPKLIAEAKRLKKDAAGIESLPGADAARYKEIISVLNDQINKYYDAVRIMDKALDSIESETSREIVFLHYAKGMTVRNIADSLGYTYSDIYYHLQKAKNGWKQAGILQEGILLPG